MALRTKCIQIQPIAKLRRRTLDGDGTSGRAGTSYWCTQEAKLKGRPNMHHRDSRIPVATAGLILLAVLFTVACGGAPATVESPVEPTLTSLPPVTKTIAPAPTDTPSAVEPEANGPIAALAQEELALRMGIPAAEIQRPVRRSDRLARRQPGLPPAGDDVRPGDHAWLSGDLGDRRPGVRGPYRWWANGHRVRRGGTCDGGNTRI